MLKTLEYLKLKNILLKNYRNTRVCIETRGAIHTKTFIHNSKLTINKYKLFISDEENDIVIEFMDLRKIKLNEKYHIELEYIDFTIILEL